MFKKIMAIALSVLMLCTVFVVPSFAAVTVITKQDFTITSFQSDNKVEPVETDLFGKKANSTMKKISFGNSKNQSSTWQIDDEKMGSYVAGDVIKTSFSVAADTFPTGNMSLYFIGKTANSDTVLNSNTTFIFTFSDGNVWKRDRDGNESGDKTDKAGNIGLDSGIKTPLNTDMWYHYDLIITLGTNADADNCNKVSLYRDGEAIFTDKDFIKYTNGCITDLESLVIGETISGGNIYLDNVAVTYYPAANATSAVPPKYALSSNAKILDNGMVRILDKTGVTDDDAAALFIGATSAYISGNYISVTFPDGTADGTTYFKKLESPDFCEDILANRDYQTYGSNEYNGFVYGNAGSSIYYYDEGYVRTMGGTCTYTNDDALEGKSIGNKSLKYTLTTSPAANKSYGLKLNKIASRNDSKFDVDMSGNILYEFSLLMNEHNSNPFVLNWYNTSSATVIPDSTTGVNTTRLINIYPDGGILLGNSFGEKNKVSSYITIGKWNRLAILVSTTKNTVEIFCNGKGIYKYTMSSDGSDPLTYTGDLFLGFYTDGAYDTLTDWFAIDDYTIKQVGDKYDYAAATATTIDTSFTLDESSIVDGKCTASVTLAGTNYAVPSADVVIASYKGGELVGLTTSTAASSTVIIGADSKVTYTAELDIEAAKVDTVKAFLWDSVRLLNPICESIAIP